MSAATSRPELSEPQAAAVDAEGGVFVDAGAGSGKTTVLVERYVRSVTVRNHLPSQVLAVTFTTRAAGELRARIRARLRGEQRTDLIAQVENGWIGTIHATCRRILAEHPDQAGLLRGLRVADQVETVLLRDTAFERAVAATVEEHGEDGLQLVAGYGMERLRSVALELLSGARIRGLPPRAPTSTTTPAEVTGAVAELREAALVMSEAGTDSDQAVRRRRAALDLLDLLAREPEDAELADLSAYARGDAAYKQLLAETELVARDAVAAQLQRPLQFLLDRLDLEYQSAKDAAGAVDNDDLQLRTLRLLEEHPDVRTVLQERFREIMVDEFQDTDSLQTSIISLLRAPTVPLLAVGDEQQAIYGFRGADVEVFRAERVRSAADDAVAVVALHENRRSVPEVLDAVNAIFAREPRFAHRPLIAVRDAAAVPDDPAVELLIGVGGTIDEGRAIEATLVARRLGQLIRSGQHRPGDVAIVFRAGTRAPVYERALRAEGLPTVSSTGRGFLSRQPVGDVVAMLRVLWNRYDDVALLTCLASPMAGVSNDGLALLRAAVEWEFCDALNGLGAIGLKDDDLARAATLRDAIARLREQAGRLGLGDLVAAIVAETRYDLALLAHEDGAERMANVEKLQRVARAYDDARGPDLPGFVRAIDSGRLDSELRTEGVIASEDDDAIRLMSVHQAKGLEFPVVVFADTASQTPADTRSALVSPTGEVAAIVPSATSARCSTRALERLVAVARESAAREDHRIAYVACTRAEDRLIISGARGKQDRGESTLRWLLALVEDDGAVGQRVLDLDGARIGVNVSDVAVGPVLPPAGREDTIEFVLDDGGPQLAFDVEAAGVASSSAALAPLQPLPKAGGAVPPVLSYSALDLLERCAYRFHVERVLGLPAARVGGAAAIGKAVHRAIELGPGVDLAALLREQGIVAADAATAEAAVARWYHSPLAARFAVLAPVLHEQAFLLRIAGATLTGRFDLSAIDDGRLVIGDVKVGGLHGQTPAERRDAGYVIQEEVYALAGLEAGYAAVDVAYQWLGDDEAAEAMAVRSFAAGQRDELYERLAARVRVAASGPWRPSPSPTACAGCPALEVLCAGPGLRSR